MEKTIEFTLLSYDVEKEHHAVKEKLKAYGYEDSWFIGPEKKDEFIFTNTSMMHLNKNCNTAIMDLRAICNSLDVKLLNSIAVNAKDIVGTRRKAKYNFTPCGPHE